MAMGYRILAMVAAGILTTATGVFPAASWAADSQDSNTSSTRPSRDDRSRDRWGPGMMQGYQGGPGMMGRYYGGMGPGMMGGYSGGMGPGMMGGYAGGMGPGMMDGIHGGMMGGGCSPALGTLGLSSDQKARITKVCDEVRRQHWDLAGKMMDEHARMRDLATADQRNTAAILKEYANLQALQRQMLEQSLQAESRIEDVLNKDQLAQYRDMRRWGGY